MAKEQPEMKRISDGDICGECFDKHAKSKRPCAGDECPRYVGRNRAVKLQLAADKSHCAECKARQEKELNKLAGEILDFKIRINSYEKWHTKHLDIIFSLKKEIASLKDRIAELEQIFDLSYKADMRAIIMWRKGHPERNLTMPDKTDMVIWLLERLDKFDSTLQEEIVEHLSEIASLKSQLAEKGK